MPRKKRAKDLRRGATKRADARRQEVRKREIVLASIAGGLIGLVLLGGVFAYRDSHQKPAVPSPVSTDRQSPTGPTSPEPTVCENAAPGALKAKKERTAPYPMTIDPNASYEAEMSTSCGTMLVKLFPKEAPVAVNNFVHLAQNGWFTGQIFYRINKSLGIIQAGDPDCPISISTCGKGGPGYTIPDEFNNGLKLQVGSVVMANTGLPNSAGSQFIIAASDAATTSLTPKHTIFGQLVGEHSYRVARLILSVPTRVAPGASPGAPAELSDGEYVYIKSVKIIQK